MIDELDLNKFEGHTPGPLIAYPQQGPNPHCMAAQVFRHYGDGTAVATFDPTDAPDESSANAELFAAAPALLAEVKRLREFVARLKDPTPEMIDAGASILDGTGRHHGWWPSHLKSYAETDDAIAKSEFGAIVEQIFRAMLGAAAKTPLTSEEIDACTEIWSPKHANTTARAALQGKGG